MKVARTVKNLIFLGPKLVALPSVMVVVYFGPAFVLVHNYNLAQFGVREPLEIRPPMEVLCRFIWP